MQSSTCRNLGVDARAGAQIMLRIGESMRLPGPQSMWISDLQFPGLESSSKVRYLFRELPRAGTLNRSKFEGG